MNYPNTISAIQSEVKRGNFSVSELVENYIQKIKKDKTNSFITTTFEIARKKAKNINTKLPLHGVVVAHKDLFLTKGVKTTAGSKILENYIPKYSGTVVKKLEEAGCILIGKTNCDAWGHGGSSENSDFGPTKNPYNKKYVAGGSSSGSAVAVSEELTTIATGTDTGGSIRQPASFCGVYGFKPTYGSVSRYGVIAMASSTDSIGHFGNCVDDIEKVFNVTKGVDGLDSVVVEDKKIGIRKEMILGVPREYFGKGLDSSVKKAVENAIKIYEKLGVKIEEISLPHTKYVVSTYYIIQPAEVSSNLGRYDGIRYGNKRKSFGNEAKRRIMLGTYVLSSGYYEEYYAKAMKVRTKIAGDFDNVFKDVDAVLAPVSPTPAFKLGEKINDPLKMYLADTYSCAANLADIPALAIPYGKTKNNLPLGFQLMGKRFSENVLFKLGRMFNAK